MSRAAHWSGAYPAFAGWLVSASHMQLTCEVWRSDNQAFAAVALKPTQQGQHKNGSNRCGQNADRQLLGHQQSARRNIAGKQ